MKKQSLPGRLNDNKILTPCMCPAQSTPPLYSTCIPRPHKEDWLATLHYHQLTAGKT